jgi:hypothetical protein
MRQVKYLDQEATEASHDGYDVTPGEHTTSKNDLLCICSNWNT